MDEFGPKWLEIAARLPDRTDHAARNRYHRLQRCHRPADALAAGGSTPDGLLNGVAELEEEGGSDGVGGGGGGGWASIEYDEVAHAGDQARDTQDVVQMPN